MKFKSIACPQPSLGLSFEGIQDMTVPNQAMSLKEILERFTRNEPLPIEFPTNFHDSDDDIEKIRHMDLVDREEFMDSLERIKQRYEAQVKKEEEIQRQKIEAETRAKIENETREKIRLEALPKT